MTTRRRARNWGVGLASLLALGLFAWWLEPFAKPAALPGPSGTAPSSLQAALTPPRSEAETAALHVTAGAQVRPAGSAELDATGMVPHPLTAQHERIFHENNLIGDLNGAMDVKDTGGMRRLLRRYRDEYPEDAHVLQDGYELIANCLEHPSVETRNAAQRYYDEQLDSGLRRYIRRHCLEAQNE